MDIKPAQKVFFFYIFYNCVTLWCLILGKTASKVIAGTNYVLNEDDKNTEHLFALFLYKCPDNPDDWKDSHDDDEAEDINNYDEEDINKGVEVADPYESFTSAIASELPKNQMESDAVEYIAGISIL